MSQSITFRSAASRSTGGPDVRPFLTGLVGLTRYAAAGDNEIRFTTGGGGGVKSFRARGSACRLDGRVFATFVQANATALACANGSCLFAFHVNIAWQAEFTAGVVVRLGSAR